MAVTRLQRKGKRNKIVAKARLEQIKLLTRKPVVKKVDVEELKNQQQTGVADKIATGAKKVVDKVEQAVTGGDKE